MLFRYIQNDDKVVHFFPWQEYSSTNPGFEMLFPRTFTEIILQKISFLFGGLNELVGGLADCNSRKWSITKLKNCTILILISYSLCHLYDIYTSLFFRGVIPLAQNFLSRSLHHSPIASLHISTLMSYYYMFCNYNDVSQGVVQADKTIEICSLLYLFEN